MKVTERAVYKVGQVLKTSRLFYKHIGIVTDRWESGEQLVICCSNRRGKVVEERLSEFLGGFLPELVDEPTTLTNSEILSRARAKLGQRYDLFTWNCEHFVSHALGRKPESPQLIFAIMTGLSLLLVAPSKGRS